MHIFDGCAADPACNQAFPDLEQEFYDQVEELDMEPKTLQLYRMKTGGVYHFMMNGDRLINVFFDLTYKTHLQPQLPKLIYDLKKGDWDELPCLIREDQFMNDYWSEGMYFALECVEEVPFSPLGAIMDANEQVNPRFASAINNEGAPDMCAGWEIGPISQFEDQPIASEIPVLILNGENDPITTNTWAERAAETLSSSQYIEFAGFGHGIIQSEIPNLACMKIIMDEFLNDPMSLVDDGCVKEFEQYFVGMD
jgi:pimeloyl-ACP methyl ester carboxylesterase